MISLCVLLLLGFHPFSPFTSLLEGKQGIVVPFCRRRKKRLGKSSAICTREKKFFKVLEQGHRQCEQKRPVNLGESETMRTGFPKQYLLLTLLLRVWVSKQLQIAVYVG